MVKLTRHGLDIHYISDQPKEIKKLESCLKIWVEGCEFVPAFRNHEWDGFHRFYVHRTQTFSYGLLHVVQKTLTDLGIDFKIVNDFKPIVCNTTIDSGLWAHQKRAVETFLNSPYGTLQIPTRGGKTKVASEIIRIINKKTLFIVDSQILFEQALNDISDHLKIKKSSIGQIRADVFEPAEITVASIQTLQSIKFGMKRFRKKNAKTDAKILTLTELKIERAKKRTRSTALETFLDEVQLLIVDEVHEYASDDRHKVVKMVKNLQAGLFLSATPEKSGGLLGNLKIKVLGGDIIYKVAERDLKAAGILAQENIVLVMIDHDKNNNIKMADTATYNNHKNDIIVNNEYRNNILVNVIQICRSIKIKTLVLFHHTAHAEYIHRITGDELLTGSTDIKYRMQVVKKYFKTKTAKVLLATNIFNKGVTLPEVEVMINAAGGLEQSNVVQKKGRTLGTTESKKKAMTIDFADLSEYFSTHSLSRIAAYEASVGIENISIFDAGDSDFYQDLRELLSSWKRDV